MRAELAAAIGKPCAYCGQPMATPTKDHVRPKHHGGTLDGANKAIVCWRCNNDKGSRSIRHWLSWLRRAGDVRAEIVAAFIDCRN